MGIENGTLSGIENGTLREGPRSGRYAPSAGAFPECALFNARKCAVFDAHLHPLPGVMSVAHPLHPGR